MFSGVRKDLRPFIIKLRLKFLIIQDQYLTETSKVSYGMFCLDGDVTRIIDSFFRNGIFIIFKFFVSFLEQTYDGDAALGGENSAGARGSHSRTTPRDPTTYNNVSREYTAITYLKNLRQRDKDFITLFSEFLKYMGELN